MVLTKRYLKNILLCITAKNIIEQKVIIIGVSSEIHVNTAGGTGLQI